LEHPAIAVRVNEISDARIGSARGIESGCKPSIPGSNGHFIPDFTDIHSTPDQKPLRGAEVLDDEEGVADRTGVFFR